MANPAHREHGGQRREQFHEGEVRRRQARGVDAGGAVLARHGAEPGHVALLAVERLGHPDARDALLEVGVHRGDAVAHPAVGLGAGPAEQQRGDHQRGHHGDDHQ